MSEVLAPGVGDNSAVIDVERWSSTKQDATPEPSQAESVAASEPEPVEAAVAPAKADESKAEEKKEPEAKPQRDWRIDEYYRLRAEAERKVTPAVEQPKATPVAASIDDPKPTWEPEKYADKGGYDGYVEVLAEWAANKRFRDLQAAQANQVAQAESFRKQSDFAKRVAESGIADYADVLNAASQPIQNGEVLQAIMESAHGPQLAYHLAKNPEDVVRLNSLSLRSQLIELGKLEARFAQSNPVQNPQPTGVSKAPPPVQPLRPKSATPKNDPSALLADGANFRAFAEASGMKVQTGRFGRNR